MGGRKKNQGSPEYDLMNTSLERMESRISDLEKVVGDLRERLKELEVQHDQKEKAENRFFQLEFVGAAAIVGFIISLATYFLTKSVL